MYAHNWKIYIKKPTITTITKITVVLCIALVAAMTFAVTLLTTKRFRLCLHFGTQTPPPTLWSQLVPALKWPRSQFGPIAVAGIGTLCLLAVEHRCQQHSLPHRLLLSIFVLLPCSAGLSKCNRYTFLP